MDNPDRAAVLDRLRELEGWAEYIFEALLRDQKREPVIEGVVDPDALKRLREISWSLKDKLHILATEVELSREAGPAFARR